MSVYVTHWPGDPFDILCTRIVIPETCLADRIWNYLWNGPDQKIEVVYRCFPFRRHSRDLIDAAYRQLIREERAWVTPGKRIIHVECKEPPWWFDPECAMGRAGSALAPSEALRRSINRRRGWGWL